MFKLAFQANFPGKYCFPTCQRYGCCSNLQVIWSMVMDKEDSKKSMWDHVKSMWSSLPEAIRLIATILSIAIALKALFPVAALEISGFNADPEIIEPGGSSVLSWEVSGADNITIEPGIGPVSSNGSLSVSPSETTAYKLTATDKGKGKSGYVYGHG